MSKAIEILLYVQGVVLALAMLGNGLALLLRALHLPGAAAKVDQITPLAMRLGMAKTAKEAIDLMTVMVHTVTTTPANSDAQPTPSGAAIVSVDLTPAAPESSEPPKAAGAPPSGIVMCLGFFALLALGCTDPIPAAKVALAEASTAEITAAEKLDARCTRPMELLALEPPGNDRTVRARALEAKCEVPETAYDAVREAHLKAIALLERAGTDEGVTVGEILDAIRDLTKKAEAFATAIEALQ